MRSFVQEQEKMGAVGLSTKHMDGAFQVREVQDPAFPVSFRDQNDSTKKNTSMEVAVIRTSHIWSYISKTTGPISTIF